MINPMIQAKAKRPSINSSNIAFSDEENYDIVVDFWENQRYKLLGWSVPFMGGISPYSNLFCDKVIPFDDLESLDISVLPKGWQWVEDKWEPSLPRSVSSANESSKSTSTSNRGDADMDGWSYGTSFESMVKQAQDRLLQSERSTINIARRRRWIRTRRCDSKSEKRIESYRRSWTQQCCKRIDSIIENNSKLARQLQDFNSKWRRSIESVKQVNDSALLEINNRCSYLQRKLQLLHAFLLEQGSIESAYASKLYEFSRKWSDAGNNKVNEALLPSNSTSFAMMSRMVGFASNSSAPSASATNQTDGPASESSGVDSVTSSSEDNEAENGFFKVVSAANEAISSQKKSFSLLLSEQLPKDVNLILQEVDEILEDRAGQGVRIRKDLEMYMERAETFISQCIENLNQSVHRMSIERSVMLESLTSVSASFDAREACPVLNIELFDSASLFANDVQKDYWLLMLKYAQAILSVNNSMLLYHAHVKMSNKRTVKAVSITSDLLRSTVKVLAHEHFKVYQESISMLESIGMDSDVMMKHKATDASSLANAAHQRLEPIIRPLEPLKVTSPPQPVANLSKASQTADPSNSGSDQSSPESGMNASPSSLVPFASSFTNVAFAGRLKVRFAPEPLPAGNGEAPANEVDSWQWHHATVIFTFDRFLHILADGVEGENGFLDCSNEAMWNKVLYSLGNLSVLQSINTVGASVNPIYLGKHGYRNAFEMKLSLAIPSSSSSSSSYSTGSVSSNSLFGLSQSANTFGAVHFVCPSIELVGQWMKVITYPFCDLEERTPSDFAISARSITGTDS